MTGRTMKTRLDLLKPQVRESFERNALMEKQFNNHHGAKWKQFEMNDEVFIKLHANNKWTWVPATVIEKSGSVNYIVQADTPSGTRQIKVHANQMKKRFNVINEDDSNILMDDFELPMPQPFVVEPEVVPEPESDEEFEDAREEHSAEEESENESEEEEEHQPQMPLRRSARPNIGIPPQRYQAA
jgi:hypothetical protein